MTKRSVSVLALIAIGVGVLGSWAAGCSLQSGGVLNLDDDGRDTVPRAENIAPATDGDDILKQPDADR